MTPLIFFAYCMVGAGAAVLIAAWLLWQRIPPEVRKRVESAMKEIAARGPKEREHSSASPAESEVFRQIFTLGMPHNWGVHTSLLTLALVGLIAGGSAWVICHVTLGLPFWAALPLAVSAGWYAPRRLARMVQDKEDKRFLDQFPEAIDMIVRMLRAGLPVSVAIRTVAEEAAAPINGVFKSLADQSDIGVPFEDALGNASERIGLPDFRFFANAVTLQRTTGGNLAATLETLGDIIRRRGTVRLKARAATGEVRISAYVLASLPFLVFGALLIVSPSYLEPLLVDRRGNVILIIAILMLLMAFLTMRLMMRSAVRM